MYQLILKNSLWCAIIWTLIIFGLCCMPGSYIPSTNWLELISFDKFVHASIFFILTALWFVFLVKQNKATNRFIVLILLACVAYGGLLEIMQATVFSQRSADWFDFIANSFGCVLAWWLFYRKRVFLFKSNI